MEEPTIYSLDHANGSVELTLTAQRFIAKTQGKGLLDKPRTIDIPFTDLEKFCLVPTINAQNVVAAGRGTPRVYDDSYDSEFIFSYREGGKLKRKRVFVNREGEAFSRLLEDLKTRCPAASLLDLDPAEAQQQIGALSARKAVYIVIGLIVGVPVIIMLIVLISNR
jgi:hypothetical protein